MYKIGDLHNIMMEKEITCPSFEHNSPEWQRGFRVGVHVSKNELSLIAIRFEGYVKRLEQLVINQQVELSAFSDGYKTKEQIAEYLEELKKECNL